MRPFSYHKGLAVLPLALGTLLAGTTLASGTDLSVHSQAHLSWMALRLNEHPRETLGIRTRWEVYREVVASTP